MKEAWEIQVEREQELGLRDEHEDVVDRLVLRGLEHAEEIVAHIAAHFPADGVRDPDAHHYRDLLLLAALRAIVGGSPEPVALAAAALKADEFAFSRWYS